MLRFINRFALTCLFLLTFGIVAISQDTSPKQMISPDGDTIIVQAVKLSEIPSSIEKTTDLIKKVNEDLKPGPDLLQFDSIFNTNMHTIEKESKKLESNKNQLTLREINEHLQQWNGYLNNADRWKKMIQDRTKQLNRDLFNISVQKEIGELTYKQARENGVPNNVLTSVSEQNNNLKKLEKQIKSTQTRALERQNNITKSLLIIDQVITDLTQYRSTVQSDYLRQDSPYLWNAVDSTAIFANLKILFKKSFHTNKSNFISFLNNNYNLIILQFLIFLILWAALFSLNRYLSHQDISDRFKEDKTGQLEKAKYIVGQKASSAMIITLLLSIWFYPNRTATVNEVLQLSYIILALVLLPSYLNKKLSTFLYSILLLFLINDFQLFIPGRTLIARIAMIIENLLGAWILFQVIRSGKDISNSLKYNNWGFFLKIIPVFFILLGLSFIGNLFGFVNIAFLLNNAVINSTINFIILILVVLVINKIFSILLRLPFTLKANLIRNHVELIEKRIHQVVRIAGIFLWFKAFFVELSIYGLVYQWFSGFFQTSWSIGKTSIDIGGIFNFLLIIIITYYFTGFVKAILKEEVFPRIRLPRGVPGAISMITGYVIAGYGIFLAIGAIADLGKFGLLAGTLGVGIGFGLQGIVANFIAGLVLAFERPIQIGDTIEVNNMMGDVVSIGVRSSIIRTFDGSEVVIPNSTLITNDVVNWTLTNRRKRRDINVSVAYGSDPHQVMELIKKVATDHPDVSETPAPWALFDGFGDSSLNFRVRIWTSMDTGMTTKSDVAIGIYDALSKAGIEIPFPQQDLHVRSIDPEIEKLAFGKKTTGNISKTRNKPISPGKQTDKKR